MGVQVCANDGCGLRPCEGCDESASTADTGTTGGADWSPIGTWSGENVGGLVAGDEGDCFYELVSPEADYQVCLDGSTFTMTSLFCDELDGQWNAADSSFSATCSTHQDFGDLGTSDTMRELSGVFDTSSDEVAATLRVETRSYDVMGALDFSCVWSYEVSGFRTGDNPLCQ